MRRLLTRAVIVLLLLAATAIAAVWWLGVRDAVSGEAVSSHTVSSGDAEPTTATARDGSPLIAQGAYLARAGNCMGCHTSRGGAAYAGGRGVPTPFGTVYAPNITPDATTGIGLWSAADFWRALHHGRARDGRLLYPAFPYPNYTRITRGDSDALFAYLRSLAPVAQPNTPHALRWPFDQQAALAVWRALYFRPAAAPTPADAARGAEWARGAYLVEGLGHCNACHASRNALGATQGPLDLAGGLIPVQNWYAPSLTSPREAGVADWDPQHIVDLLRHGVTTRGALVSIVSIVSVVSVMGPMTEVVSGSTQHLSEPDLRAVATFLKALPPTPHDPTTPAMEPAASPAGAKLYDDHCASCHGAQGEGAPGAYPALAGNRAVLMRSPANLVHATLEGGFPPTTAGNPRPYGMPPFAPVLSNDDVAAVLTHIRSSWGNRATAVTVQDVVRLRASP